MCAAYPELKDIKWAKDGVNLFGFPVGNVRALFSTCVSFSDVRICSIILLGSWLQAGVA